MVETIKVKPSSGEAAVPSPIVKPRSAQVLKFGWREEGQNDRYCIVADGTTDAQIEHPEFLSGQVNELQRGDEIVIVDQSLTRKIYAEVIGVATGYVQIHILGRHSIPAEADYGREAWPRGYTGHHTQDHHWIVEQLEPYKRLWEDLPTREAAQQWVRQYIATKGGGQAVPGISIRG